MKKTICIFAALTCIASFTACGDSSSSSESATTTQATIHTEAQTATPTEATSETTAEATTTPTTEGTTKAPEEPAAAPQSSSDFVEIIGKDLEITNITKMAAEMIGAEEGTSFMYKGNKFEIYRFKADDPKIEQAKSGSLTYIIEGFGEFTSNSSVNGDYIMIYDTPDEDVIQAFNNR